MELLRTVRHHSFFKHSVYHDDCRASHKLMTPVSQVTRLVIKKQVTIRLYATNGYGFHMSH